MGHHGEKIGAAGLFNTAILRQVVIPLMVRKTHPTVPAQRLLREKDYSHPDTANIYKNDHFVKMKRQARKSRLAFI
jgi:ABC-type arginine transport system permease subunit